VLAAGLTALVAVGAAVLVAAVRDPGAPAPESLDRRPPVVTSGPAATSVRSVATQPPPAPAGPLRPAPATTTPAPPPPTPAASTPASRDQRRTPAPTTPPPAGPAAGGRATFYTLTSLPNCGYEDAAGTGRYVALSPAEYDGSAACGTVLDVTGPNGTVRVTVSDQCPECEPGHIDLAAPAFALIAEPVAGIVPVTVARVVDPPTPGPIRIRVKEGSSEYWLAVLPLDTGNPLDSVEARTATGWQRLARSTYGYWIAEQGAGPGPVPLRLTDDRGHTVTATVTVTPGTTQTTGVRLY
jgi:hypothetical protein